MPFTNGLVRVIEGPLAFIDSTTKSAPTDARADLWSVTAHGAHEKTPAFPLGSSLPSPKLIGAKGGRRGLARLARIGGGDGMAAGTGGARRAPRRRGPVARFLRMYLALLPLSALATVYLLIWSRATVADEAGLRRVVFGWPFPWVAQDLSRMQPTSFPVVLEFSWRRVWHDPIPTTYDAVAAIGDALLVGIGITVCVLLIGAAVRPFATRPSGVGPRAGERSESDARVG